MKTRILNLKQAHELYLIIKPVFPEGEEELLPFLQALFENIGETDTTITVTILKLLLGEEDSKINELGAEDAFVACLAGFEKNKIISLYSFFSRIVDGRTQ